MKFFVRNREIKQFSRGGVKRRMGEGVSQRVRSFEKIKAEIFMTVHSYSRLSSLLGAFKLACLFVLGIIQVALTLALTFLIPALILSLLGRTDSNLLLKFTLLNAADTADKAFFTKILFFSTLFIFILKVLTGMSYLTFLGKSLETVNYKIRGALINLYYETAFSREKTPISKEKVIFINGALAQFISYQVALMDVLLKFVTFLGLLFYSAYSSPMAFFLCLLLIPLVVGIFAPLAVLTKRSAIRFYDNEEAAVGYCAIALNGAAINMAMGGQTIITKKIEEFRLIAEKSVSKLSSGRVLSTSLGEAVIISLLGVAAAFTVFMPQTDLLSQVPFVYSLNKSIQLLSEVISRFGSMLELRPIAGRVYENLPRDVGRSNIDSSVKANRKISKGAPIKINNLKVMLDDKIIFEAVPGDLVNIKGGNGSGKSTFLYKFLGLCESDLQVRVNDSLQTLSRDLPDRISYFSQDTFIFPGTILENIIYLNKHVPDDSTHSWYEKFFPNLDVGDLKLSRNLASNGSNVSGGERQFISIIRCLLRPADIYVLDEYANHLSIARKSKIEEIIKQKAGEGAIVIFISHDAELKADKVVEIEGFKTASVGPVV